MHKTMETPEKTHVRPTTSRWYCCSCGQKLFKVLPGAVVKGLQIKCKKCRNIIQIDMSL